MMVVVVVVVVDRGVMVSCLKSGGRLRLIT